MSELYTGEEGGASTSAEDGHSGAVPLQIAACKAVPLPRRGGAQARPYKGEEAGNSTA
jgi:hypothetical protein